MINIKRSKQVLDKRLMLSSIGILGS